MITPSTFRLRRTFLAVELFLMFLCGAVLFTGCYSTMRFSQRRDFSITRSTPIVVVVRNDYEAVQGRIEERLLSKGFDVVPEETARKVIETKQNASISRQSVQSYTTVERSVYYPKALILVVSYSGRTDAFMTGFKSFTARFIDLESNRVLGVASFSQGGNWVNINYTLNQFVNKVESYVGR